MPRDRRAWAVPARTLALGVYGLFGFHFLLFIALRHAPPVEANLVNYLWPLLHGGAGAGAAAGHASAPGARGRGADGLRRAPRSRSSARAAAPARRPAVRTGASCPRWARPSSGPATRCGRSACAAFPTSAIGLFGLVSGALSLACHALLEPPAALSARDWLLVALCGLGPLGAAFFLWDMALKRGDARQIGILSYITPLASTALLMVVTGRPLTLEHRARRGADHLGAR